MTIKLTHRIQLDPTIKQVAYFRRACGTARFVWNLALAEWNRQYQAGAKPSGHALRRQFNANKYEKFPWMRDIHRDAHARPFANLQKAFTKFFAGRGNRPKFKKKGRRDSFYIANDKLRLRGTQVRLPVIGWLRMNESLRFTGKVLGAAVIRDADRWFLSVQVDVGEYHKLRTGNQSVGVDLGITTAATLSNGEKIEAPKPLRRALRRLRIRQRCLSRRKKGSKNRQKQRNKIARIYARIRRIRHDFLHKLTTKLCRENQAVVVEDLNVKGMLQNHKLARAISDIGFYELRRQLEYKSVIYGTRLVIANRWFPSSKTCNACGNVNKNLMLSDRTFRCDECGYAIDRDVNAAKNLHDLRTGGLPGINACGPGGNGQPSGAPTSRAEAGTKPRSLVSAH